MLWKCFDFTFVQVGYCMYGAALIAHEFKPRHVQRNTLCTYAEKYLCREIRQHLRQLGNLYPRRAGVLHHRIVVWQHC